MKKINLKGLTKENIAGVLVLLAALINAVLQMFGIKTLPIENEEISNVISTIFLIGTALYNTWKNRNLSSASQIAQNITNALKNGELLEDDIKNIVEKFKSNE